MENVDLHHKHSEFITFHSELEGSQLSRLIVVPEVKIPFKICKDKLKHLKVQQRLISYQLTTNNTMDILLDRKYQTLGNV